MGTKCFASGKPEKNGRTGEGVTRLLIFDMISSPGVPQSVRDVMESAILKN